MRAPRSWRGFHHHDLAAARAAAEGIAALQGGTLASSRCRSFMRTRCGLRKRILITPFCLGLFNYCCRELELSF